MASPSSLNLLNTNLTTHSAEMLKLLHTLLNQSHLVNHVRWTVVRVRPVPPGNKGESVACCNRARITNRP